MYLHNEQFGMPKEIKNREPVQPTTRSKRQPRHHDGTASANPQAQSAPILIDPVAPARTTKSLLYSEQLQQVSQAVADILSQNQTQPMPIEPLQPSMAGPKISVQVIKQVSICSKGSPFLLVLFGDAKQGNT